MNRIFDFVLGRTRPSWASLEILATLTRFIFVATLFLFFWNSAMTKFDGWFQLSSGAYYQIFPKAFEASGFAPQNLAFWRKLIVFLGSIFEFLLPLMIALGLFTRLAALGMIGFLIVMTLTDIFGHGVEIGSWFDGDNMSLIADMRLYWLLIFVNLGAIGGGYLSIDRLLHQRFQRTQSRL